LYEKRQPQWIPARIEDVTIEDIHSDFLSPVEACPIHRLDINFKSRKYEMFLLPTTQEVFKMKSKYNPKLNTNIIKWFVNNRKQKFGVREKVEDILNRQSVLKAGKVIYIIA